MAKVRQPFDGKRRMQDGITVFFENEHGEQMPIVGKGAPVWEVLRGAILQMEAWPGKWHVAAISSPSTIFRDLQGSRDKRTQPGSGGQVHFPELSFLSRIGRLDLWHG